MIVNLTPHAIKIDGHGTIEASGTIARVAVSQVEAEPVSGIRVRKSVKGAVIGIPEPQAGTIYLVSGMVLDALQGARADVYAPDTGADAIRNEKGHIVAVRGLVQ